VSETSIAEITSTPDRKVETVFKAQAPLTPVENGHGYMGVLLRDTVNDVLQCHICGEWKKGLANHVSNSHKMTADDYRDEYKLPISCPLVSKTTSEKHSRRARSKTSLENLERFRNSKKALNVRRKMGRKLWKRVYNLSHDNKHNLCPEQINRRFIMISDIVEREPTQRDLLNYDHALWAGIRRRYGNLNNYRKKNGFQVVKRAPLFNSDALISHLRKFVFTHRRTPRPGDFRCGSPNIETFRKQFGSWARALILAGFHYEIRKFKPLREESNRVTSKKDKVMQLTNLGFTAQEISKETGFDIVFIHKIRKEHLPERHTEVRLEESFSI
jgi:predicted transcriptional regulator